MSTKESLINLTNGDASSNNVARMFPGKDQDHTTEDHEFDTDKQEDSFANNQYSEFHDILELFFSCFFDRYNPFFKINMKTMIQALVRQSEPTTVRRILVLLPRNGKGQKLGISFFNDNNTNFWNAVAQWEKILCNCDFQVPIETVPKILNREEMYLAHWNARVAFVVKKHTETLRRSQLAHTNSLQQPTKRRKLIKKNEDGTRKPLSDKK